MRRFWAVLMSCVVLLGVAGCTRKMPEGDGVAKIYCVSTDGTRLVSVPVQVIGDAPEELISGYIKALGNVPESTEVKAPLLMGFDVKYWRLEEGIVTLDLGVEYKSMDATTEVMVRAAIVKTLCQVESVKSVLFTVAGETLLDAAEQPVGEMYATDFVQNDGK